MGATLVLPGREAPRAREREGSGRGEGVQEGEGEASPAVVGEDPCVLEAQGNRGVAELGIEPEEVGQGDPISVELAVEVEEEQTAVVPPRKASPVASVPLAQEMAMEIVEETEEELDDDDDEAAAPSRSPTPSSSTSLRFGVGLKRCRTSKDSDLLPDAPLAALEPLSTTSPPPSLSPKRVKLGASSSEEERKEEHQNPTPYPPKRWNVIPTPRRELMPKGRKLPEGLRGVWAREGGS